MAGRRVGVLGGVMGVVLGAGWCWGELDQVGWCLFFRVIALNALCGLLVWAGSSFVYVHVHAFMFDSGAMCLKVLLLHTLAISPKLVEEMRHRAKGVGFMVWVEDTWACHQNQYSNRCVLTSGVLAIKIPLLEVYLWNCHAPKPQPAEQ